MERKFLSKQSGARIIQIYNEKRLFSLENRYTSIKDHCHEKDIIVDLDSDDSLIGVHVFQLINTMYQRYREKWAVYFTCIADTTDDTNRIGVFYPNVGPIPDKVF